MARTRHEPLGGRDGTVPISVPDVLPLAPGERQSPLRQNAVNFRRDLSVVLDASGNGLIRISPTGGKDWRITTLRAMTDLKTVEAVFTLYDNYVGDANLMEFTYTGSSGDVTDTVFKLMDGNAIMCEWLNGNPGATATVAWSGEEF